MTFGQTHSTTTNAASAAASSSSASSKYQICEEIGRGRFGTVSRVLSTLSGDFYACKTIDKSSLSDDTDRSCLENEPKLMAIIPPHPNIIQIHDLFESEDSVSIVMELVDPAVTIYDRLISVGNFSESLAASYFRQILSALSHCHKYGVVHRDIKPENVLVDLRNGVAKLCDFGSGVWLDEGGTTVGIVGTPYYVAPEVLMGREYDEKIDVWSAGVVLYTMLAGATPFYGDTPAEIFEAVVRGNLRFPSKSFRGVSSAAKDLMRKMICRDPSRRFSAEQALGHPWILRAEEAEAEGSFIFP